MTSNSENKPTNAITESVMAVNQLVLGSAASTAMATMYVSMAHAAGVSAQNTVSSQQHLNILGAASVSAGSGNILWDGISRQVGDITMSDRIKYWQQMVAIAGGQPPTENDDAKEGEAEGNSENAPAKANEGSNTSESTQSSAQ